MALQWAWSWENESAVVLTDYGFAFSTTAPGTNAQTNVAADLWTYTGSPTRYSMQLTGQNWMQIPPEGWPSSQGCISIAGRLRTGVTVSSGRMFEFTNADSGALYVYSLNTGVSTGPVRVEIRAPGIYGQPPLYLDTAPIDFTTFHYYTLKFNFSTTARTVALYVDGVLAASGTHPFAHPAGTTVAALYFEGIGSSALSWVIGQIITYDLFADTAENPRFVTNFDPTADGTNVGTWVPTAASDWQSVGGPLNTASYTEEATPTSGEKVNVLGGTLTSQLGVVPTNVDAVVVHTVSTGEAINARAEVGDGVATTDGTSNLIDAVNPTYASVTATTKPSGGAWTGADSPELNYEIV
jgi:hypothetical protein